jgi:hypothetical protein
MGATASGAGLDHADSLGLLHRQTTVLELIAAGTALPDVLAAEHRGAGFGWQRRAAAPSNGCPG